MALCPPDIRTFTSHAHLETLLESAVLALVAVVLVYGTVSVSAACVRQIPPHRPLEETFAAFARELSVVLAATFIAAYDALQCLLI